MRTGVVKGGDEKAQKYIDAGIVMCDRWRDDFWAFVEDMGPKPTKSHTVDRVDNTSGYNPQNCRWATKSEQLKNRNITKLTDALIRDLRKRYDAGESALSLSKEIGLSYDMVRLCVKRKTWAHI